MEEKGQREKGNGQQEQGQRAAQGKSKGSRRASAGQWLITSYTLQRVSTGDKDPGIKPAEEVRGFVVDGFARCSNSQPATQPR